MKKGSIKLIVILGAFCNFFQGELYPEAAKAATVPMEVSEVTARLEGVENQVYNALGGGFGSRNSYAVSGGSYSLQDALRQHDKASEIDTLQSLTPNYLPGANQKMKGSATDITRIIQRVINIIIMFAGTIAVLFFVWNAGVLVISVGVTETINKAKQGLTWSAAGLVLIIFAYVIVKTIIAFTYSAG